MDNKKRLTPEERESIIKEKEQIVEVDRRTTLTPADRKVYDSLTNTAEQDEFYFNAMQKYSTIANEKLKKLKGDSRITSIHEIDIDNLDSIRKYTKIEELDKKYQESLKKEVSEYTDQLFKAVVNKRNKRDENGKLDTELTVKEYQEIATLAADKVNSAPANRLMKSTMGNASAFDFDINQKMLDSKIEYETIKITYCNEFGMTPESFDEMMEWKLKEKQDALANDPMLLKYLSTPEYHVDKYKQFAVKVDGFVKGETIVYRSEFLDELYKREKAEEEQHNILEAKREKTGIFRNTGYIPRQVLDALDIGIAKKRNDIEIKKEEEQNTPLVSNEILNKRTKSQALIKKKVQEDLVALMKANKEKEEVNRNEDVKDKEEPRKEVDLFKLGVKKERIEVKEEKIIEEEIVEKEVTTETTEEMVDLKEAITSKEEPSEAKRIDTSVEDEELALLEKEMKLIEAQKALLLKKKQKELEIENAKNIPINDATPINSRKEEESPVKTILESSESKLEDVVETIIPDIIERSDNIKSTKIVDNIEDILKAFRSEKVENEILEKIDRKPDVKTLRNSSISNPGERIRVYKESGAKGFRVFLPYSGYEVIVKKLVDVNKLSYLLKLVHNGGLDLELIVEQECMKILYSTLEFPDIAEVSFKDFISNTSVRDIPILMTCLAMTNKTPGDDGRITLGVSKLKCLAPDCFEKRREVSVENITIDMYDLFSKIYPTELYIQYYKNVSTYQKIDSLFRSSHDGVLREVSYMDDEYNMRSEILVSKPTIYKTQAVNQGLAELNYEILKDNIKENATAYEEQFEVTGLLEMVNKHTLQSMTEESKILMEKIAMLKEDFNSTGANEKEQQMLNDEFLKDNATILTVFTLLQDNSAILEEFKDIVTHIDAVKITAVVDEEEETIVSISNHDDLYYLYKTIMGLSSKVIDKLSEMVDEIKKADEYERDANVLYTSDIIKGHMDKTFLDYYSPKSDDKWRELFKERDENVEESYINHQLQLKANEYKNLTEGKCRCGGDMFELNYISIIFFSIYNRLEVM